MLPGVIHPVKPGRTSLADGFEVRLGNAADLCELCDIHSQLLLLGLLERNGRDVAVLKPDIFILPGLERGNFCKNPLQECTLFNNLIKFSSLLISATRTLPVAAGRIFC